MEMIEAGQVANLIVKDASRLGREYLQVGYYMEIYFPQKNGPLHRCQRWRGFNSGEQQ